MLKCGTVQLGGEIKTSKDQAIGAVILALCIIVIVGYLVLVGVPSFLGLGVTETRLDVTLILVSIGFIAILVIGAWIGWTMATTPPPKPIEEITAETQAEANPQTESKP